jgi:hypothetical protein
MQAPQHLCASSGGVISLFQDEHASQCSPLSAISQQSDVPARASSVVEPSHTTATSCSVCAAIFSDFVEQRAHFKSDWHRCICFAAVHNKPNFIEQTAPRLCVISSSHSRLRRNLQRHIKGIVSLTEEQFDSIICAAGHESANSSISGSASEDSDGSTELDEHAASQHNLSHSIVQHPSGILYVCWSTVFDTSDGAFPAQQPAYWSQPTAVILCSGGHFAATLFERNKVLKSKTFHRYVVRAKQVPRFNYDRQHSCNEVLGRQAVVARPKEAHQQARRAAPRVVAHYNNFFFQCWIIFTSTQ